MAFLFVLPVSVTDARGNVLGMAYDGFDRLSRMNYPLASGGGASASDVVAFAYDKRGAMTKRSIRGTSDVSPSCTQCIAFGYDAIGLNGVGTGTAKIYRTNSVFGPRLGITEMPPATNVVIPK